MRHLALRRLKKIIGSGIFNTFFPLESKRLNQFEGVGKPLDLILFDVPSGNQGAAVSGVRNATGWSIKKATDFVKQGILPKVVLYNITESPETLKVANEQVGGYPNIFKIK